MASLSPELLAPAGNWDCARAAVANGADAIYFGLPKFNARMRADNFTEEDLPKLMEFLHQHGVRGFVAFNTLVFASELEAAAEQLRLIQRAGVDAIIVQDIGLARLARAIAPGLELHASTQMTITSPEGLNFVKDRLGLDRAVIARENSLREIHLFHAHEAEALPLEVFVHGALCVAYSGQCLTSESLGQRSANRGECAQACRMPYDLVVDGEDQDLGDRRYLLSPQDLAGIDEIPALLAEGVSSFKIEGRLKTPEYVSAVTRVYRKAIDAALAGNPQPASERDRYELEMSFSRGLYSGWLHGVNHQELAHARFGKKRGAFIGFVEAIGRDWVQVQAQAPLRQGDGVVFDTGGNTEREQGGRIYEIQGKRLSFKRGKIDFRQIKTGDRIWKTDDPKLNAELQKSWTRGDALKAATTPVTWKVEGQAGAKLCLTDVASGQTVESAMELEVAQSRPLSADFLFQQLGRLGNTPFHLEALDFQLEGEVILPVSELNRLRRALVDQLETPEAKTRPVTDVSPPDLMPEREKVAPDTNTEPRLLCRTEAQLDAALDEGLELIYLDLEDVRRYREVLGRVRKSHPQARIYVATPRIQKPGEVGLFRLIERAKPHGVLVRNLGGAGYFQDHELPMIGDFSLNVSNPITADFFMHQGFENLTVSYDLNIGQVLDLLSTASTDWFELTLHQHMPMFHMEHCVFCAFLSDGTDFTNCGRPCDSHEVQLRDRVGQLHVLSADIGCRNTLFNGRAQSGARFFRALHHAGLRKFRVELLKETADEARATIRAYRALLSGESGGEELWQQLQVESKLGVTEGTLS